MAVYKRGDVYWFEKNQRTASDIERAFRTALAKGDVGITERRAVPGFRSAMSEFLRWSEEEHRAHRATHRRYETSSIALLRYFRDAPLDSITPDDVERYKACRSGEFKTVRAQNGKRVATNKKLRPATINRELACLKATFNFVIKSDAIAKNPVSRVKFLPENNQQSRVLSYVEQQRYLANASPVLRDIATLIFETGMRPEEVYTVRPENIDLAHECLMVPHGKTAAARRRINLTSSAREVLRRRMSGLKTPYLFACESDPSRPIPKVNNAHDRAVKASGIAPARLYDFRHTWATRAAMSGIDLVTLAAMLGHSRIQMVLRYAHPTQEHQTKAMEKLEEFNASQQIREFQQHMTLVQ
jgi:integrase